MRERQKAERGKSAGYYKFLSHLPQDHGEKMAMQYQWRQHERQRVPRCDLYTRLNLVVYLEVADAGSRAYLDWVRVDSRERCGRVERVVLLMHVAVEERGVQEPVAVVECHLFHHS